MLTYNKTSSLRYSSTTIKAEWFCVLQANRAAKSIKFKVTNLNLMDDVVWLKLNHLPQVNMGTHVIKTLPLN